ncbi:MAG: hypothetical protein KatS3mg102_1969 [Planctomycetota bacterium]|nr:MAG: hypothetical protein KatS3mg102_1969 [Planctomycetota bacterium]
MLGQIAAGAVAGALVWSFLEYALHDWYGHRPRGRNEFSREHLSHHADTRYFSPAAKKLKLAVPVLGLAAALAIPLAGAAAGCAFTAALALSWLGYEVLHRRIHTHPPRGPYGRWARRHHLHHHFANPRANHGVTSPLWDLVFGTWERPARIVVPQRQAMPWLCDPKTGGVRPEYAADYEVRRPRGRRTGSAPQATPEAAQPVAAA